MGRIVADMRWWLSFSAIFVFCCHARAAMLHEEMVPMRDGIRLFTRVMTPGKGRYPCVFSRTPYPRGDALKSPYPQRLVDKDVCVRHGYVSVGQHCRGFGLSEGLCRPYEEREDGLATLEWIRRQPWYNGEIFLNGGSYLATVHLAYLSVEQPDIKGAALSIQVQRGQAPSWVLVCDV